MRSSLASYLSKANLWEASQTSFLGEVQPAFTEQDNKMFRKLPTKQELKESVKSANTNATPGNDGLTFFVYKTEVVQEVFKGGSLSLS